MLRKLFTYFIVTLILLPCNHILRVEAYNHDELAIHFCLDRRTTLNDAHFNALTGTIGFFMWFKMLWSFYRQIYLK